MNVKTEIVPAGTFRDDICVVCSDPAKRRVTLGDDCIYYYCYKDGETLIRIIKSGRVENAQFKKRRYNRYGRMD